MKQVFMTAFLALAIGTSSFAATNEKTISYKATIHFSDAFKNAKNVTWKSEPRFDKATFVMDGVTVSAFYDSYGELIGTSKPFAFDKLPKAAIETITTKYTYPSYQLKDCIEFENANGEKNYYVSFDKNNKTLVVEINRVGILSLFVGEN